MACLRRLERPANGLEVRCSIQLSYRQIYKVLLERVMGIEPTQSAWKADVLPLNYTRIKVRLDTFRTADFLYYTNIIMFCQHHLKNIF